jgi:hypothetical protein
MKIRIVKTDEVVDMMNHEILWVLERSGIITFPAKDAVPERQLGNARWFVNTPVLSEGSTIAIVAQCDACGTKQVFRDGERPADPKTGKIPPSVLHKAFLEHCKKREFVPKEILDKYFATVGEVWR